MKYTELSLDFSRTSSLKVLRVFDTSGYCETDIIDNYLLEVLPPISNKWLTFHVTKHFNISFNASSLKMQKTNSVRNLVDLPDGVYTFKQSYKPNFETFTEYDHFRISALQQEYNTILCKLYSEQCSINKKEFEEKKMKMLSILLDMKAAVIKVEDCLEKKQGLDLYEKAKEDLKNFTDECGC